jgi:hypothetical protein
MWAAGIELFLVLGLVLLVVWAMHPPRGQG